MIFSEYEGYHNLTDVYFNTQKTDTDGEAPVKAPKRSSKEKKKSKKMGQKAKSVSEFAILQSC
jgi:hypothetical protein